MMRETDASADTNLGGELDGAPPEVRAAAVRRSRLNPEPSIKRAAWLSLPLEVWDRIGVQALTHSFYSTIGGLGLRALIRAAGRQCERRETKALTGIGTVALAALPKLYCTPEKEPQWARQVTQ